MTFYCFGYASFGDLFFHAMLAVFIAELEDPCEDYAPSD